MLDLDFAQLSDPGKARANNEDYLGHYQPPTPDDGRSHGWLFALADGVGGREQGEVASRAAVEYLLAGFPAAPPGEPLGALLVRLVRGANQQVYEIARQASPGGSSMATTLVACALRYNRAAVAHAGDSRCYLLREGRAAQLTRDHTVAQDRERLKLRSPRETTSAGRHQLIRSLGSDLFLNVDTSEHQIFPGDVLLLASDGLHHSVSEADIAAAAGGGAELSSAARQLVAIANERDGSDNISVQLIRVRSVEPVGIYRGRPYKLR